jgi:hypothetical protein
MDKDMLRKWREANRDGLAAQLVAGTANREQRTVDVVWFTGGPVDRYNWWTDEAYKLHFDLAGADLSHLNNGAPVCDNHIMWRSKDQLGAVRRAWRDGKNFMATLQFSLHEELDRLWLDIENKIVSKFSMGVEFLELEEKRDKAGKLVTKTARKWRPYEISVAPIPADFGTTTLSSTLLDEPGGEPPLIHAIHQSLLKQHAERELAILRLR